MATTCARCRSQVTGRFCTQCGLESRPASGPPPSVSLSAGEWLAAIVRGPFPAGTPVNVESGYRIFALVGRQSLPSAPEKKVPEQIVWALEPGRHVMPQPCDLVMYVRDAGVPISLDAPFTRVPGPNGMLRGGRVWLKGMSRVYDVLAAAKGCGAGDGLTVTDANGTLAQQPVEILAGIVIREKVASGAWSIAALENGALLPEFCHTLESAHNTTDRVDKIIAGLGIQILEARLTFSLDSVIPRPL